MAEADRTATNSGAELGHLIAAHTPGLTLVDEWVAHARKLYDRED